MNQQIALVQHNELALFDKHNYIEPKNNSELEGIYSNLQMNGSELAQKFNSVTEQLNGLIARFPGHAKYDGKIAGKLVQPIEKTLKLRSLITKKSLRAGWFARSGSGKSTILNRLYSDDISCPEDYTNPCKVILPMTTGGQATSSCAFSLLKKNDNEPDDIRVDFLKKQKLQKKLVASMVSLASIGGFSVAEERLRSVDDCKNIFTQWTTNGDINRFRNNAGPYLYVLEFIEKMLAGHVLEQSPRNFQRVEEAEIYSKHGDIKCANVYQISARIVNRQDVPKIFELVDVPGSNAQKLDLVYFDFIEKSLDMMIFMFKEGGGNINDVDQVNTRDRYLNNYWQTYGVNNSKRFVFVYNKARKIEPNRPDLCQNKGSLKWARNFVFNDLSRLFLFDGFDFSQDQNRFPFDNYHDKSQISGIDEYWSRIEPLNDNGGLHFLRNYLFVEWPLIVCDEIKTSISNQILELEADVQRVGNELRRLASLNRPDLQQELSDALNELKKLKTQISCEFTTLKNAISNFKQKVNVRMSDAVMETWCNTTQTPRLQYIQNLGRLCRESVLNDIYPFLIKDFIMAPIEELCRGIHRQCRWKLDSEVSRPLADLIRSRGPMDIHGYNQLESEISSKGGDKLKVNYDFFKDAINPEFFKLLENCSALNELRDESDILLAPMKGNIDFDRKEPRIQLFKCAKNACFKLITDIASVIQIYWFNTINEILDDLNTLTSNVRNS